MKLQHQLKKHERLRRGNWPLGVQSGYRTTRDKLAGSDRRCYRQLETQTALTQNVMYQRQEEHSMNRPEALRKIEQEYSARAAQLGDMLLFLAFSGQPCDVTF